MAYTDLLTVLPFLLLGIIGVLAVLAALYLGVALLPALFARDRARRTDAAKVIDKLIDLILRLLRRRK